jgi:NADPH:quinone reductase-like Zn-dependent oxidoreductase
MVSDLYDGKREDSPSKASTSLRATHWKDPKFSKLPSKMHQDPNDTMQSDISDIPPTQPVVEQDPKHPSQPSTRTPEAMKQPPESPRDTSEAMKKQPESPKHISEDMKQPSEPPKRTSYAPKPTSSTLNDSAFTPLSMRALYYTPDGADSDTPDGIPEGEISDAMSPDTSTGIVRQKGTNLIFDPGFPTPQPSPQQYLLKISTAAFCHDEIRLAGLLNPPNTTPQIPLHSLCGTVISTPREDDEREEGPKFKIGDVVFGVVSYTRDGGAADYAVATESELALKPDNITVAGAAALALPALTAWQALFRYAGLDPDVPGGLNEVSEELGGGNGMGAWLWQRQRRQSVLGSQDYGYGHRKSTVASNGALLEGTTSGNGNGNGNGRWIWQWNRGGSKSNGNENGTANGEDADIDHIPPAARAANPTRNHRNVRRESLMSLLSGNPSGKKTIHRAASTIDPNPKRTVRRNSLIGLIKGSTDPPATRAASTVDSAAHGDANNDTRRGSLNRTDGNATPGRRASLLGSIIGNANTNGNGRQKPPKIRVLVTNARDNDIGRIAVQILRADSLFPAPVRPWICVTCTQVEADIIEKDWDVDEIVIIPHLPSREECNIEKVFRARRWEPVDIVLDCSGGEVFRAAHAAGVVKDYGAVLTVVDGQVALQSPLVPENDVLGERRRGIKSRFVPVNPDGAAMERIAELVEESLVRGREITVVDIPRAADLLAAGAAGTAGNRRGGMVVVRVNSV